LSFVSCADGDETKQKLKINVNRTIRLLPFIVYLLQS